MKKSDKVSTVLLTEALIRLISQNIIARTEITSNVTVGGTTVNVGNSFQFHEDDEVVLIDQTYGDMGGINYNVYEYAKIKRIISSKQIELYSPVIGTWLASNQSAVQKTIGHSPLFPNNIYYGDRDVIPADEMAITVEITSMSNDWIYLQGGLSEEYSAKIVIYGKSVSTLDGKKILDKYSDAVYRAINENLHLNINDFETRILSNVASGSSQIIIANDAGGVNLAAVTNPKWNRSFFIQDNNESSVFYRVENINTSTPGQIILTIETPVKTTYRVEDFARLLIKNSYIYDSRVKSSNFGTISKGSAVLRASELTWFGKIVNEHHFPQTSNNVSYLSN